MTRSRVPAHAEIKGEWVEVGHAIYDDMFGCVEVVMAKDFEVRKKPKAQIVIHYNPPAVSARPPYIPGPNADAWRV